MEWVIAISAEIKIVLRNENDISGPLYQLDINLGQIKLKIEEKQIYQIFQEMEKIVNYQKYLRLEKLNKYKMNEFNQKVFKESLYEVCK